MMSDSNPGVASRNNRLESPLRKGQQELGKTYDAMIIHDSGDSWGIR